MAPTTMLGTARSRTRTTVIAVVVLIISAATMSAVRSRSSSAFTSGSRISSKVRPSEVHVYGLGAPRHDVDILSATVRFAPDSAPAAVTVSICTEAGTGELGHAVGWQEMQRYCASPRSAIGGHLRAASAKAMTEYLIVTLVPLEVGTVVVERVDVRYRSQGHTRTDPAGPRIELAVSAF